MPRVRHNSRDGIAVPTVRRMSRAFWRALQRLLTFEVLHRLGADTKVVYEASISLRPLLVFLNTQQIGRVNGDQNPATVVAAKDFAADFRDGDTAAKDAARGRDAKSYDDDGLHNRALPIEPPAAPVDFIGVGALVKPALAALLEFEMFYCVSDKDPVAIEPGVCDRAIEQ